MMVSGSSSRQRGRRGHHRQDVGREVADRGGDDERPRALDRVAAAEFELRAAPRALPRFLRAGRTGQEAARLARGEPLAQAGPRDRGHRPASAASSPSEGSARCGHSPFTQRTRDQASRGSKLGRHRREQHDEPAGGEDPDAGNHLRDRRDLDQRDEDVRASSLRPSTRSPATSVQRSSVPTQRGAGGRRTESRIASRNPICRAGATTAKSATSRAAIFSPCSHISTRRRAIVVLDSLPGDRQHHQRLHVGDDERRSAAVDRQRRRGSMDPGLQVAICPAAARAARRSAGRKRGNALEQVALGTGDDLCGQVPHPVPSRPFRDRYRRSFLRPRYYIRHNRRLWNREKRCGECPAHRGTAGTHLNQDWR